MNTPIQKVALITGASSGIGAELARQLASAGWFVGLMARREDKLEEIVQGIRKNEGHAEYFVCDVTDASAMKRAVSELLAKAQAPLTWLIANAGYSDFIDVNHFNTDTAHQVISTNLLGVTYTVAAGLPHLLKQERGRIIVISSIAGSIGLPGASVYCASKAAVNIFCESLRRDLFHKKIAVTVVCPGFIKTPMIDKNTFPMPMVLEVDVAARKIIQAAERGCDRFIFPRALYWLTLFGHLAPNWLWKMVPKSARFSQNF